MSLLQALLLGLVQGITEFLPVSSSGHLAIMQNLLNINTDTGVLFDVILHLGTLTAIFIAFWKDIKKLVLDGCGMIYDIVQNFKIWSHNRREHDAKRYKKSCPPITENSSCLLLFLPFLPQLWDCF
ncbi:MAG: undecaprenyl-diphosphate phosphatase [Blautia marasmi]